MEARLGLAVGAAESAPIEPSLAPVTEAVEDDCAPVGPSVTEEMALLATEPAAVEAPKPADANEATGEPEDVAADAALPALDELVKRIPAEARAAMDELFRAKFTAVRRVPRQTLKN